MQSGILQRDTLVETRADVLMFAHGPHLRSTSTAHGIALFTFSFSRYYIVGSLYMSLFLILLHEQLRSTF